MNEHLLARIVVELVELPVAIRKRDPERTPRARLSPNAPPNTFGTQPPNAARTQPGAIGTQRSGTRTRSGRSRAVTEGRADEAYANLMKKASVEMTGGGGGGGGGEGGGGGGGGGGGDDGGDGCGGGVVSGGRPHKSTAWP
jgi:uncharacterized membrane protein YgcG